MVAGVDTIYVAEQVLSSVWTLACATLVLLQLLTHRRLLLEESDALLSHHDGKPRLATAPASGGSGSGRRTQKVGQLQRLLYRWAIVPCCLVLLGVCVDPLGAHAIYSQTLLDFLYYNVSATIYSGLAIVIVSTVRVHIVVVRSAAVERSRRWLNLALVIVLCVIPFVSANVCASLPLYIAEDVRTAPRAAHLLSLALALLIAAAAFNLFAAQLKRALNELAASDGTGRSSSAAVRVPPPVSPVRTPGRLVTPPLPSPRRRQDSGAGGVHSSLRASLARFARFQRFFNLLSLVTLSAQAYFGISGLLDPHAEQPVSPTDGSALSPHTLSLALFHYIHLTSLALGVWYSWLPLRLSCRTFFHSEL